MRRAATRCGTGEWMEIPTSVGFCVYLRREALDAVGPFDEQLFGTGYGEENDLSCRMRDAGYLTARFISSVEASSSVALDQGFVLSPSPGRYLPPKSQ